jgi:hypothetical protein
MVFMQVFFLIFSCCTLNSLDGPVTDMREACKKGFFIAGRSRLWLCELTKQDWNFQQLKEGIGDLSFK